MIMNNNLDHFYVFNITVSVNIAPIIVECLLKRQIVALLSRRVFFNLE